MIGTDSDRDFWSDRLEVDVDAVLARFADAQDMKGWTVLNSERCRTILAKVLGLDPGLAKREMVELAPGFGDEVLPLMLADEARKGKAEIVIRQVAKERLSDAQYSHCAYGDDNFDRTAAMWYLYQQDPLNLERVFFLDIIHQKGYARMVLTKDPANAGADPASFFTRESLNPLIAAYDKSRHDHRSGHCSEILAEDGRIQVIVRRDLAPDKVQRAGKLVHGYRTEWIILEFYPGLKRVDVCSVSPDVPAQLADRIGAAFFDDKEIRYENDAQFVSEETVRQLLDSFKEEKPLFPLLELQFKNSGINGSPEVRMKVENDASLAPAIEDYEEAFGDPFERLDDIMGMKVLVAKKRIRIKLEKDEQRKMWVVRYVDTSLSRKEREEFEAQVKEEFGIPLLSTEKKYARD
jgi:hypothetical protein